MKRSERKLIIILLAVAAASIVLAVCFVDVVPPRAMTATRMHVLKRRVLQYARSHGELPKSLAALPPMAGYDNSIQDGWKRDVIFSVSDAGIVSFRSLGRDGVSGGSGEDVDIVRSFPARDASGKWSNEMVEWSEDTFKKMTTTNKSRPTLPPVHSSSPFRTLPSGKQIKITGIGPMHFPNGTDAMILACETDIPNDDMPNLRKEVDEIWGIFRKDVETANMTNGVIRITHPEGTGLVTSSKGYGFVFEKRGDGQWHCLQDGKK